MFNILIHTKSFKPAIMEKKKTDLAFLPIHNYLSVSIYNNKLILKIHINAYIYANINIFILFYYKGYNLQILFLI